MNMNFSITPREALVFGAVAIILLALIGLRPPWDGAGSLLNLGIILFALSTVVPDQL